MEFDVHVNKLSDNSISNSGFISTKNFFFLHVLFQMA